MVFKNGKKRSILHASNNCTQIFLNKQINGVLLSIPLEMVKELKQSAFQHLRTLGNMLFKWREEVVRMLRFTKNNGITEGFHRKMKLIQRRAYGFRNFENYRLRVRMLCG